MLPDIAETISPEKLYFEISFLSSYMENKLMKMPNFFIILVKQSENGTDEANQLSGMKITFYLTKTKNGLKGTVHQFHTGI